jgi:DNA-binding CsgD family transcriptional regulator
MPPTIESPALERWTPGSRAVREQARSARERARAERALAESGCQVARARVVRTLAWQTRNPGYDSQDLLLRMWPHKGSPLEEASPGQDRVVFPHAGRSPRDGLDETIGSISLDELVNKLFEVRLAVSAFAGVVDGSSRARVHEVLDKLDGLIRQVRRTAFSAQGPMDVSETVGVANDPATVTGPDDDRHARDPSTRARGGSGRTPDGGSPLNVTDREREILNLLAQGRTPKTIAADLGISIHTCRAHVRAVLDKMDVHSQLAAVVKGTRLGLLGGSDE